MRLPTGGLAVFLYCIFVFTAAVRAETFSTSFESNMAGTFSIGESPITASFMGGRAQTVGIGSYYHSGRFSWHVPSGGSATVTFETAAQNVDFWFRDTNGAQASNYRIFDTRDVEIGSGSGSQRFVNVQLSRSANETAISRIAFTSVGGGDTVVDDFSFTATASDSEPGEPLDDPIPAAIPTSPVTVELNEVLSGLVAPVWATPAPGDPNSLFVVDQPGTVLRLNLIDMSSSVFLDVSARLVPLGAFGPESFDERGLLGLAFHPNYQGNGLLYTYTSEPVDGPADFSTLGQNEAANHQAVISEWRVENPAVISSTVDPGSRRELLRIDEPQFNHNGGGVAFGLDDQLYVSLGDGGSADDEGAGHGAIGNGRDLGTILGSVLRIDPTATDAANGNYGIPVDNPLIGSSPVAEIYASGFRNPYRFSFDRQSGELWLADVGQNAIEEINRVEPGGNYGWNFKEGSFFFSGNGDAQGSVSDVDPGVPAGLVDPVAQYDHDEGIAIIGGFVYRGSAISRLAGRYVFGDFGSSDADAGRIFHLDAQNQPLAFALGNDTRLPLAILGFGQDAQGELYVLANTTGTPFGTTGSVFRITAPQGTPGGVTRDIATAIARLYSAAFDRFPRPEGLNFWINSYESGRSLVQIADRFAESAEFLARFGELDNTGYVEQLFQNILGRPAAQAGIDFWVGHLDNGQTRALIMSELSDSAENLRKTGDYDLRLGENGDWLFCTVNPEMCLE